MMNGEGGTSAYLAFAIAVIVVFVGVAAYFLLFGKTGEVLNFADFEAAGTRLGGNRGIMPRAELIAEEDVEEGVSGRALKLSYSFAEEEWCGYWMNFHADESAHDVSRYRYLKMWVKGSSGSEQFKVELKDEAGGASYRYVNVGSTEYREVSLALSSFEKVPWADSGADLSSLKQVNIVFDTAPRQGTVYVDEIRFTC